MRFGVQMSGLAAVFQKNAEETIEWVKKSGYRFIEIRLTPYQSDGIAWTEEMLEKYAPKVRALGLSIDSCQVIGEEYAGREEDLISILTKYGIRNLVMPTPFSDDRRTYEAYVDRIKTFVNAAERKEVHINLQHDVNALMVQQDDTCGLFWLVKQLGGKVGIWADLGRLTYAGWDASKFLWKYREMIGGVHYKDSKTTKDVGKFEETVLGKGLLDLEDCYQFCRAMEICQVVDQDDQGEDIREELLSAYRTLDGLGQCRSRTRSILSMLDMRTLELTPLRTFPGIVEAPNWKKDGDIIFNSEGRIYNYKVEQDVVEQIDTDYCENCNNDHVISPDGAWLAISHARDAGWESRIYILSIEGGTPRLITENTMSFLHGWSPDGKMLTYCGIRRKHGAYATDVYKIAVDGGEEIQLTENSASNDGCEYSPDGKEIWFCSSRTGIRQIWKMNTDGSDQTQLTFFERNNWFPHISPDGKKVVFLSYSASGLDAKEHLPNMQVELWEMNIDGSNQRKILSFFGGQGSINVNSWSADSKKLALVTYVMDEMESERT